MTRRRIDSTQHAALVAEAGANALSKALLLRISPAELDTIDRLVALLAIRSRTEAVRRALVQFAESNGISYPPPVRKRLPAIRSWCARCHTKLSADEHAAQQKLPDHKEYPALCTKCVAVLQREVSE